MTAEPTLRIVPVHDHDKLYVTIASFSTIPAGRLCILIACTQVVVYDDS